MMQTVLLGGLAVVLLSCCNAFQLQQSNIISSRNLKMESFNKKMTKALGVGLLGFALSGGVVVPSDQSSVSVSFVQPANAEFRAAQKRTYFRFTPKLVEGSKFFSGELKTAIDKEDFKVVEKMFELYVTKANDLGDKTDSYYNNHFPRPMQVLAGSFAERGVSPKQRTLMEKEVAFESAMSELEGSIGPLLSSPHYCSL